MSSRLLVSDTVVLATHNPGKIREFRDLLNGLPVNVVTSQDLGLPSPEEISSTFDGNASLKARFSSGASGKPAIADDSGITVDALDGQPGPATADWAETPTGRNYVKAMTRVWTMLEEISAPEPRRAQFRSTICVSWPDGHEEFFRGIVEGRIVWPMRGELGFGFDPIFLPDGYRKTFGEMDRKHKNLISHRALALQEFAAGCLGA